MKFIFRGKKEKERFEEMLINTVFEFADEETQMLNISTTNVNKDIRKNLSKIVSSMLEVQLEEK